MPDRDWDAVATLVEEASRLEPSRRTLFVLSSTADPQLRQEVLDLLAAAGEGEFLESPVCLPALADPRLGLEAGNCRLTRLLGEGGMGTVYEAVRTLETGTEQRVAVKIWHQGVANPEDFARETSALARLEHPGIARLLDTGRLANGQPYLAMEFVDGEPLDRHAARQSESEKLVLLERICEAVDAAHRALTLHRDLKPSNIMVAASGAPKLIDFGISRNLDDPTQTVAPRLTPRYASPEQFGGHAITTATDLYSLGVVMYEVLTGRNPFAELSGGPLIQAVCAGQVTPPALPRDLASIVLKAMAVHPADRYPSALVLAADLARYRRGEPVSAIHATWLYRSTKFVTRNWLPSALAAGALALVGLGFGRAYWENQQAARRFDQVHKLAHSLLFEVHDEVSKVPGTLRSRQIILTRALEYLDQLAADQSADPALQRDLAESYLKVGDVQGSRQSNAETLRQWRDSQRSFQKAAAILERLATRDRANRELRSRLAHTYRQIGEACAESRDQLCERESHGRSVALYEADSREHPQEDDARGRWLAARVRANVMTRYRAGQFAEAEPEMLSVVQAFEEMGRRAPASPAMQTYATYAFGTLGLLHTRLGKYTSAIHWYRKLQEHNPADNTVRNLQAEEGIAWNYIALDKPADAETAYGRCVKMARTLAEGRGEDRTSKLTLAGHLSSWGQTLVTAGRWPDGIKAATEALQILEPLKKNAEQDRAVTESIASAHKTLGEAYWRGNQPALARQHYATFFGLLGNSALQLYPDHEIAALRQRLGR